MGKKKIKKDASPIGALKELKKLWTIISVKDWYLFLKEIAPQNKWDMKGHSEIRGCCPYHDDKTPSFNLSFRKGFGKCFGTCEKYVGDLVNLVAKLKGCGYTEALMLILDRFEIQDAFGKNSDAVNQFAQIQEMKKQAAIAMNEVLHEIIRDNPPELEYCKPALDYLLKIRKLPIEALSNLPVGVFAKAEHLKKYIKAVELHPLFDTYFAKYQAPNWWGSIVYHYNDSPGTISKFKVRLHELTVWEQLSNINELTDVQLVKLFPKTDDHFKFIHDPYATYTGVLGLYKYHRLVGQNDTNVYITEGEFDAMTIMAAQDLRGNAEFMVLATSGKANTNVSFLRDFGIKTAWMLQDHPAKNGAAWTIAFLRDRENFKIHGQLKPLNFKVFEWPAVLKGFDLDEAVRENGYDLVLQYIYTDRNSHFKNLTPWIIDQAELEVIHIQEIFDEAIRELDTNSETYEIEHRNLLDDKATSIREKLLKWYRFLPDQPAQITFAQECAAQFEVDITQLSEVTTSMYALDTVEGVIKLIADAIEDNLALTYYDTRGTGCIFHFWDKKKETPVEFQENASRIRELIAQHLGGGDIVKWLDSLLGDNPVYLSDTDKEGMKAIHKFRVKLNNADTLVKAAINDLKGQAFPYSDLKKLNQGIHFHDLPTDLKAKNFVYFINGKRVFRGKFIGDGEETEWERINSMTDNGLIFINLTKEHEWSSVTDVADLESASVIDLRKVWEMLINILNAWYFEDNELTIKYLASYIMALPTMNACGLANITWITGERESGKTTLVQGLLGGSNEKLEGMTPILESAKFVVDATPAAVYQMMDRTSLTFIMDEAETSEDHTAKKDQNTQEIIRYLYAVPQGGTPVRRGGKKASEQVSYLLRMPTIMASITTPIDETFLSRVYMIATQKQEGREHAAQYIERLYTDQELYKLRKDITLGLVPKIPEIVRNRSILRKKLVEATGELHISNRFLESVLSALVVAEMVGEDPTEMYNQILANNKDRLMAIHRRDTKSEVLNAVLYNRRMRVMTDENITDFVSARDLILKGDYNILNNMDAGVYLILPSKIKFDDDLGLNDTALIVIVWNQAQHAVLVGSKYAHLPLSALRERAQSNMYAMQNVSNDVHTQIITELQLLDVKDQTQYTILDAGYLLTEKIKQEAIITATEKVTTEVIDSNNEEVVKKVGTVASDIGAEFKI